MLDEGSDIPFSTFGCARGCRSAASCVIQNKNAYFFPILSDLCTFLHIDMGVFALLLSGICLDYMCVSEKLTNRSFSRIRCVVLFNWRMVKGQSSDWYRLFSTAALQRRGPRNEESQKIPSTKPTRRGMYSMCMTDGCRIAQLYALARTLSDTDIDNMSKQDYFVLQATIR
jgi:hypothetical protein